MVTQQRRKRREPEKGGVVFLSLHMARHNKSDQDVASALGVARETATRWRNYPTRLSSKRIAQLAILFECEPSELLRPPGAVSLDSLIQDQPAELQTMVIDVVRRMVGKQ